ncbi:PP97 [Orf virus]|uniref:PP97 n=1 Tax=Orf virus TaxID=10258 RepID=F1AX19_ORFV|nr:PP97 [Orf virus]
MDAALDTNITAPRGHMSSMARAMRAASPNSRIRAEKKNQLMSSMGSTVRFRCGSICVDNFIRQQTLRTVRKTTFSGRCRTMSRNRSCDRSRPHVEHTIGNTMLPQL